MGAPFKPLSFDSLRFLTLKVAFLVAITLAHRVSELAALSVRRDLWIFHLDCVVLHLDPTFLPKINSCFHRAQEVVLPDFYPHPVHHREHRWHTLDVSRALKKYISRTVSFRKSESSFVSFQTTSLGSKVSSTTISRWIKACITLAYEKWNKQLPGCVTAHSTLSAATTVAWATQAPFLEICQAVT